MSKMPIHRYKPFESVALPGRQWVNNRITRAPIWCSVDLRDGNQALIEPMGMERKKRMLATLIGVGYREIEIGFPSASQTDFDFARACIEQNLLGEDTVAQVLVQCREHLIKRTFESLAGYKTAIVHFYNSTSTLQRRVVFNATRSEVQKIAVDGAKLIKKLAEDNPQTKFRFQYSPESFTQTELDYALDVCHAVMDIIKPTKDDPIIFNLPATVEIATPNHYADQIEWMHTHFQKREAIILSLHPHNDRGTGVAAAELGLMAGADRIEGTLFGNGERTGNVDLVTLGMNMVSQGVDAGIDFSNMRHLVQTAEYCNQIKVHERHPYAGSLAFTAFSGSHQDAIKKGLAALEQQNSEIWEVPYLPIDPKDVGEAYGAIIRVNSQSGKGGIAYILEADYGVRLPRRLQIEFSAKIQQFADDNEREIKPEEIYNAFVDNFILDKPYKFINHQAIKIDKAKNHFEMEFTIEINGKNEILRGLGNGELSALMNAMNKRLGLAEDIYDYNEHALRGHADSQAITYIEGRKNNAPFYGVGIHTDTTIASFNAILSLYNRLSR